MESTSQPDTQTEGEREKEERIMARRRRVEAKLEAKRKVEAGEEPQEVSVTNTQLDNQIACLLYFRYMFFVQINHSCMHTAQVVEERVDPEKERKSRQQVEKSELRLDKLSTDGSELVSNVRVAEDAREVQYRQEQEETRNAGSDTMIRGWRHACTCTCTHTQEESGVLYKGCTELPSLDGCHIPHLNYMYQGSFLLYIKDTVHVHQSYIIIMCMYI